MDNFTFELGSTVMIEASGETGRVIARVQYETSENSYLIRYKANDGRATEAWWGKSAIKIFE